MAIFHLNFMRILFTTASLFYFTALAGCGRDAAKPAVIKPKGGEVKMGPQGKVDMKGNENLSPDADKFLADAAAEYKTKQAALQSEWKLHSHKQWNFDQTIGLIELKYEDGTELLADGQILGSYSPADGTWEWAWNNPNAMSKVSRDSAKVRDVGKEYGISYLQAGVVPVPDEKFVAYLCGIGLKATGSIGIYRG